MSEKPLIVKCPTCGAEIEWSTENKFRPFCCKRCKLIDLGGWLDNSRVIRGGSDDEVQQNQKSLPKLLHGFVELHNQDEQS